MGIGDAFHGAVLLLEVLLEHPKQTLIALAVGTPLVLGGVYSCNKYDEWKAPSRAQELFAETLNSSKEFKYKEATSFLRSKTANAKVTGYEDPKRIEIEFAKDTSPLVNMLTPGRTEFSKIIIDNEPLGSADLYIDRIKTIKKNKEEISDTRKDLSECPKEYRNSVKKVYNRLLKCAVK